MNSYITAEGETAIRKFKYKGGNLSISYNFIWSPLAEQVLKIIPSSWAPNTITVAGLIIHIITTIILIAQGPFGSPAPSWALFLHGVGVFLYQTLDNVDGKQARKYHNSTPLGMIMDHGCDALGLVFLTLGMGKIICLDNFELIVWVFTFGITFGFYVSAWCQYYSDGLMILGKFNAVDDGIPVIWMCSIYSSIFGQQLWITQFNILGQTYLLNTLLAMAIIVSGIVQIYSIISQAGHHFTNDVIKAFGDLLHLAVLGVAVYVINVYSNLATQNFIGIMVGIGFTMARTISYTLLCSVTGSKFQQFQPSVFVFGIAYPVYVFFGQGLMSGSVVVYGVTSIIILEYFLFVISACQHIARTLNITIFHIFDPKQIKRQ